MPDGFLSDDHFFEWTRGVRSADSPITQRDIDLAGDVRLCQVLLYLLVRSISAKRILEIGTADGSTSIALLHAASLTNGRVTSVDPSPCEDAKRLVEACGYGHRWAFKETTSDAFFDTDDHAALDLVFIDGDHNCNFVKRDVSNALARVVCGGVIVLHDWHAVPREHELLADGDAQYGAARGLRMALEKYEGELFAFPFCPEILRYASVDSDPVENTSEGGFMMLQKPSDVTNNKKYFGEVIAPLWGGKPTVKEVIQ